MSLASDIRQETSKIVLGPEHNGIQMTADEFDAIEDYDENFCYELIHGVVVVNPTSLPAERGPNEELGYLLRVCRSHHLNDQSSDATLFEEYIRTGNSRRRADRVIWAGLGRQPDPKQDIPTIVVEFVSSGRRSWHRDYVDKRDEYLEIGVREYWIIDRFQRTLTVFSKSGDGFAETVRREGETYESNLLPGFELPLARLLATADRWDKPERSE